MRAMTCVDPFDPISTSHLPWSLDLEAAAAPTVHTAQLGESRVVDCRIGRMTGHRGRAQLAGTPGDFVALLLVHHGVEYLDQGGRTAEVRAGTAALWDGVRPVACHSPGDLVKHTLFMPRDFLRARLPGFDDALTRTIPPSSSLRLLASWLQSATREPTLDLDIAHAAGRVAIDLLRSAVGRATGDAAADTRAVRLMRARDHIDAHLADPMLSLADVAAALPVSLRYLHLLFADSGETPRQYLQRRRLERAQDLLLGAPMSVAEVAARCGFDSPSTFSRAYRNRYGRAPRDTRRAHCQLTPTAACGEPVSSASCPGCGGVP